MWVKVNDNSIVQQEGRLMWRLAAIRKLSPGPSEVRKKDLEREPRLGFLPLRDSGVVDECKLA